MNPTRTALVTVEYKCDGELGCGHEWSEQHLVEAEERRAICPGCGMAHVYFKPAVALRSIDLSMHIDKDGVSFP